MHPKRLVHAPQPLQAPAIAGDKNNHTSPNSKNPEIIKFIVSTYNVYYIHKFNDMALIFT